MTTLADIYCVYPKSWPTKGTIYLKLGKDLPSTHRNEVKTPRPVKYCAACHTEKVHETLTKRYKYCPACLRIHRKKEYQDNYSSVGRR